MAGGCCTVSFDRVAVSDLIERQIAYADFAIDSAAILDAYEAASRQVASIEL